MDIWVISAEEGYRDGGRPIRAFLEKDAALKYLREVLYVDELVELGNGLGGSCKEGSKYDTAWLDRVSLV